MANIIKHIFGLAKGKKTSSLSEKEKPAGEFQPLLDQLIREFEQDTRAYDLKLSDYAAGKDIMALKPEQSLGILLFCLAQYMDYKTGKKYQWEPRSGYQRALLAVIRGALKRKLPFNQAALCEMLDLLNQESELNTYWYPLSSALRSVEQYLTVHPLDDVLRARLTLFAERLTHSSCGGTDTQRLADRALLLLNPPDKPSIPIRAGEAWSDKAREMLESKNEEALNSWISLLRHCQNSRASRPSKKWLKTARLAIQDVGLAEFDSASAEWLALTPQPTTERKTRRHPWEPDPNLMFHDTNADILKGLIWCCALTEDEDKAHLLARVGIAMFKKVPGYGARSARIGNAVIFALSEMPGKTGLYQLAVLKIKVKYRQALALLEKSLHAAAQREGLSVNELAEMGVPSFGLECVGHGEETLGEHTAVVNVTGFTQVELTWRNAQDKLQKSVPSQVKNHYGPELKELKGTIKDLKAMLSVQRDRLEQLFVKNLTWTFEIWRERYLLHPLVGVMAQKLIWAFTTGDQTTLAIFRNGEFESVDGANVSSEIKDASVRLWHPIESPADHIKAWRKRLVALEMTQPFKQAHREVYLLTDAERNTRVYSNRFASHFIKQHQFNALASARGWHYTLQGSWDGCDNTARISLDGFDLSAEFWTQGMGEYGQDTSQSGVFLYVSTDQVRFYPRVTDINSLDEKNVHEQHPVPLQDVPAIVLSEIFRDVDLFVGVCSVGNDPQWSDGGPDGRYRDYWYSVSFGELSATAETRREILEQLVPKLQFGAQCRFIDRFLVVEGQRRTYKIHLGSGNVLMEPNNQYLCIVPDSRKKTNAKQVTLPFEGDSTLSLILSKAMLLAYDDKIKDSTINTQIDAP